MSWLLRFIPLSDDKAETLKYSLLMVYQVERRYLDDEISFRFQMGDAGRASRSVNIIHSNQTASNRFVAYERQAHQSRLRAEIARSKTEQGEYLRNVELARVLEKRRVKKAATGAGDDKGDGVRGAMVEKAGGLAGNKMDTEGSEKKKGYRQRQVVEKGRGMEAKGMESLLGSVFG